MMWTTRRMRGVVIRVVRRRGLAAVVGLAMMLPAAWIEFSDRQLPWWGSGLGIVLGATGAALLWTAAAGLGPDWIDREP